MSRLNLSLFAGLALTALALSPAAANAWHGGGYGQGWYGGGYYGYAYTGYLSYPGWDFGGRYPWYSGYYGPYYFGPYPPSSSRGSVGSAVSQRSGTAASPSYSYGASAQAPPVMPATGDVARVRVIVPADAKVSFGKTLTRQTGRVREFVSPALSAGEQYAYEVSATWMEAGREVTQTRQVPVWPNYNVTVDFTGPARSRD
jgi:uncharacterized protein (TIGR03000 family)